MLRVLEPMLCGMGLGLSSFVPIGALGKAIPFLLICLFYAWTNYLIYIVDAIDNGSWIPFRVGRGVL